MKNLTAVGAVVRRISRHLKALLLKVQHRPLHVKGRSHQHRPGKPLLPHYSAAEDCILPGIQALRLQQDIILRHPQPHQLPPGNHRLGAAVLIDLSPGHQHRHMEPVI